MFKHRVLTGSETLKPISLESISPEPNAECLLLLDLSGIRVQLPAKISHIKPLTLVEKTIVDQRIGSIVGHFARKKAQFMWIVHPSSSPPDLRDRLKIKGLKDVEPISGMARILDDFPKLPPLPADIEIRRIVDERDVSAFHQFATWRWHVPEEYKEHYPAVIEWVRFGQSGSKVLMWQAWRAQQPVSKVALYLGAGSAGIYAVVTKPEARRLGLASTLTLTALREARSLGY